MSEELIELKKIVQLLRVLITKSDPEAVELTEYKKVEQIK